MELENRRPLKSRNRAIFRKLALKLAESGVSPNAISLSSVLFAGMAGLLLMLIAYLGSQPIIWFFAAVFIQLRLLANMLDGMVAVEGGKGSKYGELWNEVPDRIADVIIFSAAGFAIGSSLGMVTAIVAVLVAYIRQVGAGLGAGHCFMGPQAKPHRMAVMTVACILLAFLPPYIIIMKIALWFVIIGGVVTIWRRLYFIANRISR